MHKPSIPSDESEIQSFPAWLIHIKAFKGLSELLASKNTGRLLEHLGPVSLLKNCFNISIDFKNGCVVWWLRFLDSQVVNLCEDCQHIIFQDITKFSQWHSYITNILLTYYTTNYEYMLYYITYHYIPFMFGVKFSCGWALDTRSA